MLKLYNAKLPCAQLIFNRKEKYKYAVDLNLVLTQVQDVLHVKENKNYFFVTKQKR